MTFWLFKPPELCDNIVGRYHIVQEAFFMNLVGKEKGIEPGLHLEALREIHKRVILLEVNLQWVHSFVVSELCIERKNKCIAALKVNITNVQEWCGRENPPQWITVAAFRMCGQWQYQIDEMLSQQRQIRYYINAQKELKLWDA